MPIRYRGSRSKQMKMDMKEGYIVDKEVIAEMSVKEIQRVMLRLDKDEFISDRNRREILGLYLEARKEKLDKEVVYTQQLHDRISEVNDNIIRSVVEGHKKVLTLFRKYAHNIPAPYNKFEVHITYRPEWLKHKDDNNWIDDDNSRIWRILTGPHNHGLQRVSHLEDWVDSAASDGDTWFQARRFLFGSLSPDKGPDIGEGYELPANGNHRDAWNHQLEWIHFPIENLDDIGISWTFHTIFNRAQFSLEDMLRIDRLRYEIELTYSKDDEPNQDL